MQPAVGTHQARQRIGVGRLQLRELAVLEDHGHHRVLRLQLLEDGGIGRSGGLRALRRWQAQLVEQDLLQLARRTDVELVPDRFEDPRLEPGELLRELLGHGPQRVAVDEHAGHLHPGQDRKQRHLDLTEQSSQTDLVELGQERRSSQQSRERLGGGPPSDRKLLRPRLRGHGSIGQGRLEAVRGKVVDRLGPQRWIEEVAGDQRVAVLPRHLVPALQQLGMQRLQVVTDERAVVAGEPARQWVIATGSQVPGRAVRPGQGDAEQRALDESAAPCGPADADVVTVRRQPGLHLEPVRVVDDDPRVDVLDRPLRVRSRVREAGRAPSPLVHDRRLTGLHHLCRWPRSPKEVEGQLHAAVVVALVGHRRPADGRRQAIDERSELQLAEPLGQGPPVVATRPSRLKVERQRQVGHDPAHLPRGERVVPVLRQPLAELALHLVQALVDGVERPELLEQGNRGLLAHARHAGEVVRGVPLERLVVEHLVRPQPVALRHPVRVVHHRGGDAHPGREQAHVVVHQLQPVEVPRHHDRVDARGRRVLDEGADDVVRLVALGLDDRHAHPGHHLAHDRELAAQVVRHRRPAGLVVGIGDEPEVRPTEIEGDDRVIGLQVRHAAEHDLEESEGSVDQRSVRGRQWRKGEIAAIDEARTVDEHQDRTTIRHGGSLDRSDR